MIKRSLSILLSLMLLLSIVCAGSAELPRNYEEDFKNMSLEELQQINEILDKTILQKKLGNAKLFVDPSEAEIAVEKMRKLTVTSDERTITEKTKLIFESSDPSIATVSSGGTIKGVSAGEATITVTAIFEDEASLETTARITVYVPVSSIKVPETVTAFAGRELDLKDYITVKPENATDQRVTYSVDDESVISVNSDGILSGLKGGKAVVTVTSAENAAEPKRAKITVKVNQAVSKIILNRSDFTVGKEKTYKLEATVGPEEATDKSVIWTSADTSIATVSASGTVTGKASGTTTITCTAKDGSNISASARVTVTTPVNSIRINQNEMKITAGDSQRIDYSVYPADATDQKIQWSSSDNQIASVSDAGIVTANKAGKCTITGTARDGSGRTARLNVTVTKRIGSYLGELTFQGLKWGIDDATAFEQLAEAGFIENKSYHNKAYSTWSMYHWPEQDLLFAYEWDDLPVAFQDHDKGAAKMSLDLLKKVGGYSPQYAYLCFLNPIDSSGRVDDTRTELCGIYLQYDNKHERGADIFVNILAKLEAQYGEFSRYICTDLFRYHYKDMYNIIKPSMEGAKKFKIHELGGDIYLKSDAICILYGKNNTGIMLKISSNEYVTLFYGKTDVMYRIQKIQNALRKETINKEDGGI